MSSSFFIGIGGRRPPIPLYSNTIALIQIQSVYPNFGYVYPKVYPEASEIVSPRRWRGLGDAESSEMENPRRFFWSIVELGTLLGTTIERLRDFFGEVIFQSCLKTIALIKFQSVYQNFGYVYPKVYPWWRPWRRLSVLGRGIQAQPIFLEYSGICYKITQPLTHDRLPPRRSFLLALIFLEYSGI